MWIILSALLSVVIAAIVHGYLSKRKLKKHTIVDQVVTLDAISGKGVPMFYCKCGGYIEMGLAPDGRPIITDSTCTMIELPKAQARK